MKLQNQEDRLAFLADAGRLDLLEGDEEISDEIFELFIKRRRPLVRSLVNFRQKQVQRQQWRANRWKFLRGIRKWHSSVKSKRFHRAMGRYLATRIFRPKLSTFAGYLKDRDKNRFESLDPLQDEALKSISSMRTHLYIDLGYYQTLEEEANLFQLLEYAIPLLNTIEIKLFENSESILDPDEEELLLRLVDENELCKSFSEVLSIEPHRVTEVYKAIQSKLIRGKYSKDSTYFCTEVMKEFSEALISLMVKEGNNENPSEMVSE